MRKSAQLLSLIFALTLAFGAFAAPAFADEGKDESGQSEELAAEDEKAREEAQKAEEEKRREEEQARDEAQKGEADEDQGSDENRGGDDSREVSSTGSAGDNNDRQTSSQSSTPTGGGTGEYVTNDKACPGGTGFKIDNLRSNGIYGPVTISNLTNTSFTWTSTVNFTAVMVKDGGGDKPNPGGTSGTASSFGQDISHVTFCLSGDDDDDDGGEVIEEPCDANPNMEGIQKCDKDDQEVCDRMPNVAGIQECVKGGVIKRPVRPTTDAQGVQVRQVPANPAPAEPAAGSLPLTGAHLASFLLSALGLITGGILMIRRR